LCRVTVFVTLFGYGIQVRVDRGHLLLQDGIGPNRRHARLPRVGHRLKRLVVIGSDGMVSLAALRWLADQDASFLMLERNGKVLVVAGPVRPSDAKLRRSQSLSHSSGAALRIARELISQKLAAQENVARHKLLDSTTADAIARFNTELPSADSITTIRLIESQAARVYWSAWSTLPVNFPKNDMKRVPEHWRTFSARVSPLTGSPRLAANPPNAILNYLYALLESESRLAAVALGLDPGIGVLHVDTPGRESLACDLMEPIRPQVDAYLLDWITRQPLRREWFFEQGDGNCRLMGSFAVRLSETAPTWGRAVAPIAEWVARALWSTIRRPDAPFATRLTQGNKRKATGHPVLPPTKPAPQPGNVCRVCGASVSLGRNHCADCEATATRERMVEVAKIGRMTAHAAGPLARLAETRRRHASAISTWQPSTLPTWLTEETYVNKIQPLLKDIANPVIMSALGVSVTYAVAIRAGRRRPHPRHWEALAGLAGFNCPRRREHQEQETSAVFSLPE
jgi:CRISPR-associated endonuclease Cas1